MGKEKSFFIRFISILLLTLFLGILPCFAINGGPGNQLLKLNLEKLDKNSINITIFTSKPFKSRLVPIKRSESEYIIFLSDTYSSTILKPDFSGLDGQIKGVEVKFLPYLGAKSNNGYTKVIIRTSGNDLKLSINNKLASQGYSVNTLQKPIAKTKNPSTQHNERNIHTRNWHSSLAKILLIIPISVFVILAYIFIMIIRIMGTKNAMSFEYKLDNSPVTPKVSYNSTINIHPEKALNALGNVLAEVQSNPLNEIKIDNTKPVNPKTEPIGFAAYLKKEEPDPSSKTKFASSDIKPTPNPVYSSKTVKPSEEDPDVIDEVKISAKKSFYLVQVEDTKALVGVIDKETFILQKFDLLPGTRLIIRQNDHRNDRDIYLVTIGNWRCLVGASSKSMKLLYVFHNKKDEMIVS